MPQLQFKGKQLIQNHHLTVKYHELIPKKQKSLTKKLSLKDNLIIHGDNLKALKALLPTYAGRVKCIYIDPPYNTGNEKWVYNDNVNHPMFKEWLGKVVDSEDLTRHDKWLCMMMPRLKLLRELLSEDGVIFISIDDNEIHRLGILMNEIFEEENFISTLIRKTRKGGGAMSKFVATNHDYVLVYGRNKKNLEKLFVPYDKEYFKRYKKEDSRGKYFWDTFVRRRIGNKNIYKIKMPDGSIQRDQWNLTKDKFNKLINDGDIKFSKRKGKWSVQFKQRANELGKKLPSIINDATNDAGTAEMISIFSDRKFDYPKPVNLIKIILSLVSEKNSIILDSFAGSGTTAHAVLQLNKEDGGNRKFILVEMENYANNITAERVRRIIKGIPKAKDEKLKKGLGGTFSYFDLGKPIALQSILSGKNLPTYKEMARYIFYTATGEEFDEKKVSEKNNFIGENKEYKIYLFYKPNLDYLKNTALTLDQAKKLGKFTGKKRLVFAPTKYLDQDHLDELRIDFAQLPFEIYKLTK